MGTRIPLAMILVHDLLVNDVYILFLKLTIVLNLNFNEICDGKENQIEK